MPCREVPGCKETVDLQDLRAQEVELDHQGHRVLPEMTGVQEIKVLAKLRCLRNFGLCMYWCDLLLIPTILHP